MLDYKAPFDDSRRRREIFASVDVLDEKINDWRSEGVLPPPGTASKRSLFATLLAHARRSLSPAYSTARYHRADTPLQTRRLAVPSLSTLRFILLCSMWYMSSAMSSNTGKAILNAFRYPITLTLVQFGFISTFCMLCSNPIYGLTKLQRPNRGIWKTTVPMAAFQVGGHVFSSVATSRIPVSTVHTIKALSPMFTVAVYAFMFGVKYSPATYISLLPLTAGVMLACSFDVSAADYIGLISAFCSALVFVSSNIFFKKIMPSQKPGAALTGASHKLDKLNLLFYASSIAFCMMIPLWLYYDLGPLMSGHATDNAKHPVATSRLMWYFLANGTVHFAQNLIAFAVLASTSPVTYSIASLIKRIAVICIAVVWFAQRVHPVQGLGIGMTFVGLWMYNNAKADVERGENKLRVIEARQQIVLPTTRGDALPLKEDPVYSRVSPRPEMEHVSMMAVGASSALTRPQQPYSPYTIPPSSSHPPHSAHPPQSSSLRGVSHSHAHHHHAHAPAPLNLASIHVHKSRSSDGHSPTGSYPSPPPSLDSPPRSASPPLRARAQTVYETGRDVPAVQRNRRGTIISGGPSAPQEGTS